jgi:3',5'-cyclic AMP phosphodiesterase CpdA
MKQFRGRKASLWQSAVDQVISKRSGSEPVTEHGVATGKTRLKRPQQDGAEVLTANHIAAAISVSAPAPSAGVPAPAVLPLVTAAAPPVAVPPAPAPPVPAPIPAAATGVSQMAGGVAPVVTAAAPDNTVAICASMAFQLAEAQVKATLTGDSTALTELHAQLDTPFGQCDPKWGEVLAVYAASRLANATIPYRRWTELSDFIIPDGRLPDNATVVVVADWGTGQDAAKLLLQKVAAQKPDVVIHLGDVYYSGTEFEAQNYFYSIWQATLGIPKVAWGQKLTDFTTGPATFHLPGNHDMYSGGAPYYTTIDMLGQPASYFCLRNANWQFIAMDTSLHDCDPSHVNDATWVEPQEITWMKDKVRNGGSRKSVLMSHHQLFSAFEKIGGQAINQNILPAVEDILPDLTLWLWGHEHNQVIYQRYLNVLARCIGHGAFPVSGTPPLPPPNAGVPLENVHLDLDPTNFYRHGYVLMKLNGPAADVSYIQVNANDGTENLLFHEVL